jgi:DNA-binding IclR family transcriptional regulator
MLLDFVCRSPRPVTLGEASRWAGHSKPTTFRLLQALTSFGLLEQDDSTRSYRGGLRLFELYNVTIHSRDLFSEATQLLKDLSTRFDETVHLAILDRGEVVYLQKEESTRAVRTISAIGGRAPAHCTGLGKALLAQLDDEQLKEFLRQASLPRFTPNTITQPGALRRELKKIRACGFSIDNGEHESEIRCIACPVRDSTGHVAAAVSLTVPESRFRSERIPDLAQEVGTCAAAISQRLGYVTPPPTPSRSSSRTAVASATNMSRPLRAPLEEGTYENPNPTT